MPRLSQSQRNSVLASINGWAPRVIDEFIDIERDNTGKIESKVSTNQIDKARQLALVLTKLAKEKSTRNVQADINLLDIDAGEELPFILDLMDDPTKVRAMDSSLRGHNAELKEILASRFEHFAATICKEYGIDPNEIKPASITQPSAPPWEHSFDSSSTHLFAEYKSYGNENYVINLNAELQDSNALYNQRKTTLDVLQGFAYASSLGLFYVAAAFCYCGCADNEGEATLICWALAGITTLLGVATFAAFHVIIAIGVDVLYGVTKLYDSLAKITHVFSNPVNAFRGLVRTGLIIGGTGAAVYGGMIAGAMIGSAFPVIGTAIGAVLGAVIGGVVGIGIAAYLSKQVIRFTSSLINFYKLNPTNPTRYQLTHLQQTRLNNMGVDMNEFNCLLKHLKSMKDDVPFLSCLYPKDSGREFKSQINSIIEDLKNGLITQETVTIGYRSFKLFDKSSQYIQTQNARNSAYFPSAPPMESLAW